MSEASELERLVAPEIADDYDLDLADGIEDETLLDNSSEEVFSITSYGADYPVDTLIARLKSESFFVPTFQRQFVWSQRHASRFIESLLMGLPVPGIFLYKEQLTNKHLVVDGQQRLRTLQFFYSGLFIERKFRLIGVRTEWEGKTYTELTDSDKRKLDDTVVHATIFQQDEPKNSFKSLYFVFERINSGGIRLSPQEIRNCISSGPLLDLVRVCNQHPNWRSAFKFVNNRQKDQELILRFFAMHEKSATYTRPMKEFLNDFANEFNGAPSQRLSELHSIFKTSIDLIWEAKGVNAFRPARAFNAAVFESVMVGLARRVEIVAGAEISKIDVRKAYDALLGSKQYLGYCTSGTSDDEVVRNRQRLAIEAFSGV